MKREKSDIKNKHEKRKKPNKMKDVYPRKKLRSQILINFLDHIMYNKKLTIRKNNY